MFRPLVDFFLCIYLKIWFWWVFLKHQNSLPTRSDITNPKLEYEALAQAFYWDDEGLNDAHYPLSMAFRYVIVHRTQLLVGDLFDAGFLQSKKFDKQIFDMAKKYFPDWVGFQPSRCSFNPELASRMQRIRKVADWQMEKMFDWQL